MGKYKRDKGLQIPMEQRQNLNAKNFVSSGKS